MLKMDIWSKEKRSEVMSHIRGKDTKPEREIRSLLHRMGFRFRLHRKDLPGSPDIVLPKYRTVIFVHGCFWHQHKGCSDCVMPRTNRQKWKVKLGKNIVRDKLKKRMLQDLGWKVITIWECEIEKNPDIIRDKILRRINA
jgi:DNA mismatch endonuclease (patch repair protein)